MADQIFPKSGLPIRRTVDLLPQVFKTDANNKFMAAVVDPLVQPGVLDKTVGYVGRRYGKTYKGADIYLDNDNTLRSRYQLEPGVVLKNKDTVQNFYDYIDFKNQLKFFHNTLDRDDLITSQDHYSWNPPIEWDLFVNFREYYWVPSGPPSVVVLGQGDAITSTYRVRQGTTSSWLITPDGLTNNPTITLYRGQTYNFEVKSPREGFYIRSAYDTGSLKYIPYLTYVKNQLAVYDGKLWRAKTTVAPSIDGVITEGLDWELVTENIQTSRFDYNVGVTNNGATNGTVTIEVALDAPDVLFYQSDINPDRYGKFVIADIEDNTKINVEKEIVGKIQYTSSNGVEFVNGLVVHFGGKVTPSKYANDTWLVENVGRAIKLIKFSDLEVPIITTQIPEVIFDNAGFDAEPFDDATAYPGEKDYLTICRASGDSNPWSRYNRWFHRATLELAHKLNGTDFEAGDAYRAKRPIIEFRPNLQLFNHGSIAKTPVDFIDTFTDDVFSKIEGSAGYSVDGEFLFQGARVLVTADTDILANNRIYVVNFITHNGVKQITLKTADDAESLIGQGVLVKRGNINKGLMFHFNGTHWVESQKKTMVNQAPMFDVFDVNGVSFSDADTYPVSTFAGTEILAYKIGTSTADAELGFSLSHLNIDNVGDILFEYRFDTDSFNYTSEQKLLSKKLNTGYYRFNPYDTFDNGWLKTDQTYLQPILDSTIVAESTNVITLNTVNWAQVDNLATKKILFYRNGLIHTDSYTRKNNTFTFANNFAANDTVSVKVFADVEPDQGYYQIPAGLEKNPLNSEIKQFTLGQAIDHISTALEVDDRFVGAYPGSSNLRNIDGYQSKGMRFLKHSGIAPMSISLLCDKDINIIKSIQYSAKHYTEFKNEFISTVESIIYQGDAVALVDQAITSMGASKTSADPFADSDMIGSGAHTDINYVVEDTGINVFALSEKFDLASLSRKAVYVYQNGVQLVHGKDYTFDSTFGFVKILATLNEGDAIDIREYVSTGFNYIPATPTKLGLYKKYLPKKFLDDTYVTPRMMIQGHDGSLTTAYGDYRDEALLELELRIYNNIKQEYNESIFDIDNILGGYYGNALYTKAQLDDIVNQEFLKWASNTDIDYTDNTAYFDRQNSFTYTYSNMTDPTQSVNLPGYWRGVYRWFYDTDRPHRCPWEMLGFSEEPTWWVSEYGAAPYTRNNLLLWEDMRDGMIRQGTRAGTYDRYKRPSIMSHIPVDGDGNLLSPLDSGLATNYTLINDSGTFVLGDISPAEYAWRSSSEWPYAVVIAMCLMKPFEFITDSFDRSRISVNQLGQTVSNATGVFFTLSDLVVPSLGGTQVSGLVTFVTSYIISKNQDPTALLTRLDNLDVHLSTRLSGFVDQTEQKYLLDSKNPNSTSSNVFVPPENYDIIFNVGVPMAALAYSGVLIEKLDRGWKVRGYDPQEPYFNYYQAIQSTTDPMMTVGGTSEKFTNWTAGKIYSNGDLVKNGDRYYRALKSHTAGASFDTALWQFVPKLPVVGGVEAALRKTFDRIRTQRMVYGTVLTTVQAVVDFLLGYEAYLKSQGFNFDRYDSENQVAYNWQTSCKEFLFWTKHNWAVGSLLTLSPSSEEVDIKIPSGVADNLFDSFYDYQIFKSDGTPLRPHNINVNRDFQSVSVSTVNTTDGIYFIRMYFVLKEHITIFSDKTVFNDVIYDKTTGYRQERIKARGFRTVDWDGDYTSPGFIFDNVNIQEWSPYTDYKLGDIVGYKSFYWTSQENQIGTDTFDEKIWTKLDTTPTKGLVANFDYRINQFADYFDSDSDGLGSSQRDLSRHVIGYQTREYLQNLAEDNVTQFKLYQGFIKEKGTANSVTKVFDKLSRTASGSVELHEEWAFRVGRLGGTDQFTETEFRLYKNQFQANPQPVLISPEAKTTDILDLYLRVPQSDFSIPLTPFSRNINPTRKYKSTPRTAGYVATNQVDFVIKTRDELTTLNIDLFEENSHVWVTFENASWNVIKHQVSRLVLLEDINVTNTTRVEIFYNRPHGLAVGDIFGIRNVKNLHGFYKITEVPQPRSLVITIDKTAPTPAYDVSTIVNLEYFSEARFANYQKADPALVASLTNGARLWIDSNENNRWEVVEKQTQFTNKEIADYGTSTPVANGSAVVYIDSLTQVISSTPSASVVISYIEKSTGLSPYQILTPPNNILSATTGKYGTTLAASPDGRWLIVGSPQASGIKTDYQGQFSSSKSYLLGDIVLQNGRLWRATQNIASGGTLDITSTVWEPVKIITANEQGTNTGYARQGVATIYEWSGQNWVEKYSFVSPRQSEDELYGSQINIGVSNGNYYLAISAPGAINNLGRVYLYKYAPIAASSAETITYSVTVGPAQGADTGFKFYLDEQYRFKPNFLVGNTYIFDQTDLSNVFYPNPTVGTITNIHPLSFSSDDANGALGNGTVYTVGVTYLLDNQEVTQAQYIARFSLATTRKVKVAITESTASVLYYYSTTGIDAGMSVVKRYPNIAREWQLVDNQNYKGIYDPSGATFYPAGAIVWANDAFYQSLVNQYGDGSTVGTDAETQWVRVDNIATQAYLPTNLAVQAIKDHPVAAGDTPAYIFDDSTLEAGLLGDAELIEFIKEGDKFGTSMSMSADGSIIVVGSPTSDGQYFPNYRGFWSSTQEYKEGDTVSHNGTYFTLTEPEDQNPLADSTLDSTQVSYNEEPGVAITTLYQWVNVGSVGDTTVYTAGEFIPGRKYTIVELGSTDWRSLGIAPDYNKYVRAPDTKYYLAPDVVPKVGMTFTALSKGSGSGKARPALIPSGKIFIYKRNDFGFYSLLQTVNAESLPAVSDLSIDEVINSGDQFGYAVDVDASGLTIVVSSPQADITLQNQGSVYVFKLDNGAFRLKQKLQSFETYNNQLFGSSLSISQRAEKIVVAAKNTPYKLSTLFEAGTRFDGGRTRFADDQGYPGQVYVFELKDQTYLLSEKLDAALGDNESFGQALDTTASVIVTGSPDYPRNGVKVGMTRIFRKDPTKQSWQSLAEETELVNIDLLKSISLYDDITNIKLGDLDIVDPNKLKIVGLAEEEIKFKTTYDPATYTNGTDAVMVDPDQAWFEKNVGAIWWNLSTAKWVHYEQSDISYRVGHWNQLAYGASIDICEWVESTVTPTDWAKLADTADGLANSISGQPYYGTSVYSVKRFTNPATGQQYGTKYYFWVKNKTIVPQGVPGRRISAADVSNLIINPASSGSPLVAIIDQDKFLFYNLNSIITDDSALFNIEYYKTAKNPNAIHSEYQLLTEGVADNVPTDALEQKWLDSLVGFNGAGNPVPDPSLPSKLRYGIQFRPIQTMFVNREMALKIVIDNINTILSTQPFADLIDFKYLNRKDPVPNAILNLYDVKVDTVVDLSQVGTVRLKKAILDVNIVDGKVDTINIIEPGFGYKVAPPIKIVGDGTGAKAEAVIDNQGRIIAVNVLLKGRKYTTANIDVRSFSVLVLTDSTLNNFWTIYSWDQERSQFYKSTTQGYDTTRYWSYIDWYQTGYGVTTRIVKEIYNLYLESTLKLQVGDIIRVKEFANGGWALLERTEDGQGNIVSNYNLVGRQNGTIAISTDLYNIKVYDASNTYDQLVYDNQPTQELRNILKATKESIFIDDLTVEWNKLFFASMRYLFSEQMYVDWAFKTSFLNAIHSVGDLEQKTSFKSDNLASFQRYLEEVKPYRTTIREYTSKYNKIDHQGAATTDFDLPPAYNDVAGAIVPVNLNSEVLLQYPWKSWADNNTYSVTLIDIYDFGADYVSPPKVLITGNGTGATAQAYISNGKVSGIKLLTGGSGYTTATVSLVGGNGTSTAIAKAVAILGAGNVRSFNVGIKFDRITKHGSYTQLTQEQTFIADGFTAVFNLNYTPTRDKTKIAVVINDEIILDSAYTISLYKSSADSYSILRGKLILSALPTAGDVITISYEKADSILDSVDRINKLYAPTTGMIGKEIGQLMTGIDFGGVQIQGTTFDVSGGWDALPWFTDNWDSVESSADFYYVADGSTNFVLLPETPADGQILSIYLKRVGAGSLLDRVTTRDSALSHLIDNLQYTKQEPDPKTIRIDDPNFGVGDNSTVTNPTALMPTFVGDGSTNFVIIGEYFHTMPGDTLIFRPVESDGTVTISDVNIIDTKISGGTLSAMEGAYSTATGMLAEEIVVDGSKFISPDQVPAPEENVPGQVLDSVSIKVFHTIQSGAAPLQSKIVISDGLTTNYGIGLTILEPESVMVYVDKNKAEQSLVDSTLNYTIDFITNEVVFTVAPPEGAMIEIISIGIGGLSLLDYQEFEADGETLYFLTRAEYASTQSVVVTVDGMPEAVEFINSTGMVDTKERTLIQFANRPARRQIVKIVCLGASTDTDSTGSNLIRVNQQVITYDGTTASFDLDKFVNLTRASAAGAMLVEIEGKQLRGVDTVFKVYDGTNNVLYIGQDPASATNTATAENIRVYVNNNLLRFILDYVYDGNENKITVSTSVLAIGDEIKVENNSESHYFVENNNLVLTNFEMIGPYHQWTGDGSTISLQAGDQIVVTWFSEYPSMNVVSDEYTGGKVQYQLSSEPISASYVWVYKNGRRLTQDQDYEVSVPRNVVYMKDVGTTDEQIRIVQYGNQVRRPPLAYEIFKDMLNIYHFKRFSIDKKVTLSKDLAYYDQEIFVTDTSNLFAPIRQRNIPGTVYINGERIDYFEKTDTSLRQLRRGSHGTAIAEVHAAGSEVVDLGRTETLPYTETQEREDFVSDGSSLIIGPLEYVPTAASHTNWTRTSIPDTYSPCDQIEVFVAGKRLRKDPISVYTESLGISSPDADTVLEAEFSVDGITPYIRLTAPVEAGTRITILRRVGNTWYDKGATTATSGLTLMQNESPVIRFLTQKSTELPE